MVGRKGNIFIVVAPSGAGKTTLVSELLAADPKVQLSVSYTTRAPRVGEVDGKSYHFVSVDVFQQMIAQQELVEYAEVHGHFYGTSRRWLEQKQKEGHDILLEIDWQGAQQIRQTFNGTIGIFVLPPSFNTLETRLIARGTDNPSVIQHRLNAARREITHIDEYDYVIINTHVEDAVHDLIAIVRAARLVRLQQQDKIQQILQSSSPTEKERH